MRVSSPVILLVALFCALSACTDSRSIGPAPNTSAADIVAQYRLGPGDAVRLTVFNQTNLSGEFSVDGAGSIALPLLGAVPAGGETVRQLEQSIAEALRRGGYLVDPSVAIQISLFRPYYILGEISSPGSYPYVPDLTVRKAVAAAHGFTYRANMKRVYIQHAGEGVEHLYDLTPGSAVQPGDTIRIPERHF